MCWCVGFDLAAQGHRFQNHRPACTCGLMTLVENSLSSKVSISFFYWKFAHCVREDAGLCLRCVFADVVVQGQDSGCK